MEEVDPRSHYSDYRCGEQVIGAPRDYAELGFVPGASLHEQAVRDLDRFAWVPNPALYREAWKNFEP